MDFLVKTRLTFSLAGYNLTYRIWESRGRPTDRGWHITRDDFAANYVPSNKTERPHRFVIDFDPNAKGRFGLIEFLYLNGSNKGWNWGMNGMTNAAFIQGPAREYFRQYF